MLTRFSKSSGPLLSLKSAMFSDNDDNVDALKALADVYVAQPARLNCKNCDRRLGGEAVFHQHGVDYSPCARCGHLNGLHEDTDEFCRHVYTDNQGQDYAKSYLVTDIQKYRERVAVIYSPKAGFLVEGLVAAGEDPAGLRFADLGAGSGYFVAALAELGFDATGYDVSETQADFARAMRPGLKMHNHDFDQTASIAETVDADVISMIGVLEHVQSPRTILGALRANPHARYLYLSLPLFSPSVIIEAVFPQVMPRHLAGGHTHLYTEQSIGWFCEEFGLAPIAEWWFGTDMLDLYRSIAVMLHKTQPHGYLADRWADAMLPAIDEMQAILDQKKLASEIHILLKIR